MKTRLLVSMTAMALLLGALYLGRPVEHPVARQHVSATHASNILARAPATPPVVNLPEITVRPKAGKLVNHARVSVNSDSTSVLFDAATDALTPESATDPMLGMPYYSFEVGMPSVSKD